MFVETAVEASRNWTSTLTRLAFGVLAVSELTMAGWFPNVFDQSASAPDYSDWRNAPSFVIWVLASIILGSIIVHVGSIANPKAFGSYSRAYRCYRVGKLGNQPFASLVNDEHAKLELAAGMIGIFFLTAFLCLFSSPYLDSYLALRNMFSFTPIGAKGVAFIAILYCLVTFLIRRSAVNGLEAIDAASPTG